MTVLTKIVKGQVKVPLTIKNPAEPIKSSLGIGTKNDSKKVPKNNPTYPRLLITPLIRSTIFSILNILVSKVKLASFVKVIV